MEWIRQGMLCSKDTIGLEWCKMNIMCPVPFLVDADTLRIFAAFCDDQNRGRIGYIDVNPGNPAEILNVSKQPVLDLGESGTFDENGVLPTSILAEGSKIYLFYCGFQLQVNVPYTSLLGISVSDDNGDNFRRLHSTPILDRVDNELFIRTGAYVEKKDVYYDLYYASGNKWFDLNGKCEPIYNLKRITSTTIDHYEGCGTSVIELCGDEYGITIPQIIRCDGEIGIIYSIRSCTHGYILGYSVYDDKTQQWIRNDDKMKFVNDPGEWETEMQCFGKIFSYNEETYLFYCGNHYGIGGLGWARLKKD